jgi:hypothetical protein
VFEIDDLRHLAADRAAQEVLKRGAIALSAAAKAGQAPTDSMTRSLIIERATA